MLHNRPHLVKIFFFYFFFQTSLISISNFYNIKIIMAVATGKPVNQPATLSSNSALSFVASAFDPSGQLFASVVPSLDLFKIQVTSEGTSGINVSLVLDKGVAVNTLAWTHLAGAAGQSKKKRKRVEGGAPSIESAVVALGTNSGDILLYSPVQNTIVSKLEGGHDLPVTSIDESSEQKPSIWSCDNSGKVVEWDLANKTALRSFKAAQPDITLVKHVASIASNENKTPLLLASSSIYLIDANQPANARKSLPAFASPATQLIASATNADFVFAYSNSERNVSVISLSKEKPVALLVAQANVKKFVLSADESVAAIITENGTVEIFNSPLSLEGVSTSSRRKSLAVASLTPTSSVIVTRPPPVTSSKKPLTTKQKAALRILVEDVVFSDSFVTLVWVEHGTVPVFEKVEWKNPDGTAKSGDISLVKAVKVLQGLESKNNLNKEGEDVATAKRYTEDHTAVKSGNDLSHLNDDDEEEASTLAERLNALEAGEKTKNVKVKDISLTKEFDAMSLKTPESFTLVLAQSLKTNDHALLESLLTTHNEENIKVSVKRLESSQAVVLLERLADKIARSPGRAGQLMVWIKWTLIAHGGYLVSVPNLAKSLSSLHLTLSNKVGMLPRLLTLQGRVEMLRTQLQMRREITQQMNGTVTDEVEEDSDIDSDVDYVEDVVIVNGEEDYEEDDEEEEEAEDEEEEDDDEEELAGKDFIEFEAEESDDDEGKALFAQDDDYDMSDVEAEGVEKLAVPDASDNEEEPPRRRSTTGKKSKKQSSRRATLA